MESEIKCVQVKSLFHILSSKVIWEISDDFVFSLRWQMNAVCILHEVCEFYLTSLFADSNLAVIHAGHLTVKKWT